MTQTSNQRFFPTPPRARIRDEEEAPRARCRCGLARVAPRVPYTACGLSPVVRCGLAVPCSLNIYLFRPRAGGAGGRGTRARAAGRSGRGAPPPVRCGPHTRDRQFDTPHTGVRSALWLSRLQESAVVREEKREEKLPKGRLSISSSVRAQPHITVNGARVVRGRDDETTTGRLRTTALHDM